MPRRMPFRRHSKPVLTRGIVDQDFLAHRGVGRLNGELVEQSAIGDLEQRAGGQELERFWSLGAPSVKHFGGCGFFHSP
jgi:hypothetical protein